MNDLRLGILGAANIASTAIIDPVNRISGVQVAAMAARDPERAGDFARRNAIPVVAADYGALVAHPNVDAVYIPLPTALHSRWVIRALEEGKHVLVEKPFAVNREDAQRMADAAADTGLVLMEAFHSRYHPLMTRLIEIARRGELGTLTDISASFCIPLPRRGRFQWDYELGGGGLLDVGVYPIGLIRAVIGEEPIVTGARSRATGQVDWDTTAELAFPSGVRGRIRAAIKGPFSWTAQITGTRSSVKVIGPYHPHGFHRFTVTTPEGRKSEHFAKKSSYDFQLEAFRDAVLMQKPIPTGPDNAIATIRVVDSIYAAAGLTQRLPLNASA